MKAAWLYDGHPILIDKKLASVIGLNESIVLQQLNYWLHGKTAKQIDGRLWIYNTYDNWKKDNFPFWSKSTVRRALDSCIKKGLIITANFNKAGFDNTKWYSIDVEKLDQVMSSASVQNEQMDCSKWTNGSAQNGQANTRYYTDITPDKNDDDHPTEDAFNLAQLAGINVNSGLNLPVFTDYINRLGNELVCYAIRRTNDVAQHPSWSYLKTVLKSLEDNHVKTVEQAEKLSKKYGQNRKSGKSSPKKAGKKPQYHFETRKVPDGMSQTEAIAKELAEAEAEDRAKEERDDG